jgi:beta-lactamase class D
MRSARARISLQFIAWLAADDDPAIRRRHVPHLTTATLPLSALALLLGAGAPALAAAQCTIVIDSRGGVALMETGDCQRQVTPASTFKVPLAAIAHEEGIVTGLHAPVWTWRKGEVAWGGDAWRGDIDPQTWLDRSVVWYSQRIARELGQDRLTKLTRRIGFGNADFSGDPGQNNGLERAWIASSLLVSPHEQAVFLTRLLARDLPLTDASMALVEDAMPQFAATDGWTLHGKTGGAYPRKADGSFDRTRGWGWFVGWAERGAGDSAERLVFVRMIQEENGAKGSPGKRVQARFVKEWPALARQAKERPSAR